MSKEIALRWKYIPLEFSFTHKSLDNEMKISDFLFIKIEDD